MAILVLVWCHIYNPPLQNFLCRSSGFYLVVDILYNMTSTAQLLYEQNKILIIVIWFDRTKTLFPLDHPPPPKKTKRKKERCHFFFFFWSSQCHFFVPTYYAFYRVGCGIVIQEHKLQVIEAQVDMPIVGAIALHVSLLTFTLRVHPDRLDYVDQVLVCYFSNITASSWSAVLIRHFVDRIGILAKLHLSGIYAGIMCQEAFRKTKAWWQ